MATHTLQHKNCSDLFNLPLFMLTTAGSLVTTPTLLLATQWNVLVPAITPSATNISSLVCTSSDEEKEMWKMSLSVITELLSVLNQVILEEGVAWTEQLSETRLPVVTVMLCGTAVNIGGAECIVCVYEWRGGSVTYYQICYCC